MKKFTFERSKKFRKYAYIFVFSALTYLCYFKDFWGTSVLIALFYIVLLNTNVRIVVKDFILR